MSKQFCNSHHFGLFIFCIRVSKCLEMEVQVENIADPEMLSPYAGKARIPDHRDKIFKDECFFSFDSPVSKNKAVNLNWDTIEIQSYKAMLPSYHIYSLTILLL